MRKWAREQGVLWALDEGEATPSYDNILKLPIEGSSQGAMAKGEEKSLTEDSRTFPVFFGPDLGPPTKERSPCFLNQI